MELTLATSAAAVTSALYPNSPVVSHCNITHIGGRVFTNSETNEVFVAPKPPLTILNDLVVRPLASRLSRAASTVDSLVSKFFSFFPGAAAEETFCPLSTDIADGREQKSLKELITLEKQIEDQIETEKAKLVNEFGDLFIDTIGLETLIDIPVVEAHQLKLQDPGRTWPTCTVKPSDLGKESVVRGIDGSHRPFVAIKVQLTRQPDDDIELPPETIEIVEVVLKRYSTLHDGGKNGMYPNNWVTMPVNCPEGGEPRIPSSFNVGRMSVEDMQDFRDLLEGKEITSRTFFPYTVKMV